MEMTEENLNKLNNEVQHAEAAIKQCIQDIMATGTSPAAIASAISLAYVGFVTALALTVGRDKSEILPLCKQSIDAMAEYVDEAWAALSAEKVELQKGLT